MALETELAGSQVNRQHEKRPAPLGWSRPLCSSQKPRDSALGSAPALAFSPGFEAPLASRSIAPGSSQPRLDHHLSSKTAQTAIACSGEVPVAGADKEPHLAARPRRDPWQPRRLRRPRPAAVQKFHQVSPVLVGDVPTHLERASASNRRGSIGRLVGVLRRSPWVALPPGAHPRASRHLEGPPRRPRGGRLGLEVLQIRPGPDSVAWMGSGASTAHRPRQLPQAAPCCARGTLPASRGPRRQRWGRPRPELATRPGPPHHRTPPPQGCKGAAQSQEGLQQELAPRT
mmetsp:Transcript_52919/g.114442  ORF Transcript_52919/g.114442 Transcript_52919/m.114442 type:complete len:287 (-) Transcript_52919:83-943(-)